ncbi:arabinose transporter [Gluconobacter cerinus]|uniref:arabinose transporter n=1 Tax=Gluconobacter cerinus TaxID=38307 RepID=UPI0020111AB8|nr:arabinose transporter [Gluconobacter cerinus]
MCFSTVSMQKDTAPRQLYRLSLLLFISYLAVAISMPTTSVFVSETLHYNNFYSGLCVGIAFLSTILTRGLAGTFADQRGGRKATVTGLILYSLAGIIASISSWITSYGMLPVIVLILGRLLLGLGESFTIVGVLAWGFSVMGNARAGRVLAVVGMALYGAFAVGSPLGMMIMHYWGYASVCVAGFLLPLIGLSIALPMASPLIHRGAHTPLTEIIGRIWDLGVIVFAQGVGFAVVGAFMPLLFLQRHWENAGWGLSAFGTAFVLVRIFCGHGPDRFGGKRIAIVSLFIEIVGQVFIWLAPDPALALAGAFLTGAGCSMVFPSMGVEVVGRVAPHLRATAMGGFAAFQDLAYGATGPVAGIVADHAGFSSVYLIGAISAAVGFILCCRLKTSTS